MDCPKQISHRAQKHAILSLQAAFNQNQPDVIKCTVGIDKHLIGIDKHLIGIQFSEL